MSREGTVLFLQRTVPLLPVQSWRGNRSFKKRTVPLLRFRKIFSTFKNKNAFSKNGNTYFGRKLLPHFQQGREPPEYFLPAQKLRLLSQITERFFG
jgi:hypothetical protein